MSRKRIGHVGWLLALLMVLSACAPVQSTPKAQPSAQPSGQAQAKPGGTLRIGSIADVAYMNPVIEISGRDWDVNSWLHQQLIVIGPNGTPEGQLAESWTTSADGKTVTVKLRKGVKWHDGHPFTADDVAFTVYTILNPAVPNSKRGRWTAIEGFKELTDAKNPAKPASLQVKPVDVLDDHTVRFNLQFAYAPFVALALDQGIIPKHLLEAEVNEGKDLLKSAYNQKPIGLGPYKFVEWRRDERIVFERFDEYWAGRPLLDRIIYRIIPDRTVISTEMETGGIDYLQGPDPLLVQKLRADQRFVVDVRNGLSWWGVIINTEHPLLKDTRMRQAIMQAIDMERITKEFLGQNRTYATGPISPEAWGYNPNLKPWPKNLEQSLRLFSQLGYNRAADGRMIGPDGKQLTFMLHTFDFSKERQEASVAIQNQLGQIGIAVKTEFLSSPVLLRRAETGDFEMAYIAYGGFVDPDGTLTRWECANINGGNISRYCSQEVDNLIAQARRSTNPDERKQLYFKVQERLLEDLPVLWGTWGVEERIWNQRFQGWTITPDARGQFKYLHKVWFNG